MSIPNAREPSPPPPLPPPKHLDLGYGEDNRMPDIAWRISNSREENTVWGTPVSTSVAPGSSLYGSFQSRGRGITEERPEFGDRQGDTASSIKSISGVDARNDSYPRIDEGYASLSGTSVGSNQSRWDDSITGRAAFKSSIHDRYQSNTQAYDKSLVSKLDSLKGSDTVTPPKSYPRPVFSNSLNDSSPTSRNLYEKQMIAQKPLSLPVADTCGRSTGYTEGPSSKWMNREISNAASRSNNASAAQGNSIHHSPINQRESEATSLPYLPPSWDPPVPGFEDARSFNCRSHQDRYEHGVHAEPEPDFPMEETSGLRRLHIDDGVGRPSEGYLPGAAAGRKRRASSPPREDGSTSLYAPSNLNDLSRRRELPFRASPAPRFNSNHGSVSSTASAPRSNSYASTLSLAASSITTMSSYGRLSPGGISSGRLSPGGVSPGGLSGGLSPNSTDAGSDSPYVSPQMSVSGPTHHRAVSSESKSEASSRRSSDTIVTHSSQGKIQRLGGLQCECCPKKPKRFETEEELMAHAQEKQYECAYCKNRFKNKNEAERHQNSLHLRRHSWSCASLTGPAAAFHVSPTRPNDADTCGYCGEEFLRTGPAQSLMSPGVRIATDRDWSFRMQHLQDVHKFGECNHAKKFFRADHFRQHLKHSHAGTSGKWTNMLENACMKDEPMPARITEEVE
ncbi:MAG: hypothetical protein M1818_006714 [Claussenomyces sp. TS43310]|nr:MAG: hypothetical protein M1818_006714 [Claussenomyces sp. TS43310]